MQIARIGLALTVALVIFGLAASCQTLALTGAKKYKVDLTQVMMKIQAEIEQDGEVSDRTVEKLENLINASRDEYGKKGSFIRSEYVLETLKQAKEKPDEKFQILRSTSVVCDEVLEMLKTEVTH